MILRKLLLPFFILLKFVLQYALVNPVYNLHRDEYLHLDQGDHPALGYVSVPPFTSWTSIIVKALGGSDFWIRFFPALFGAVTLVFIWKTVKLLKGGTFACVLAATGFLFSAMLRLNMLYQPTSFDVLCWTGLLYFLIRYFYSNSIRFLYFAAITFAFGMLNKYNIAFLAIGIVGSLILTQRSVFRLKHAYIGALVAFLIISPNIYWQFENNLPVIWHMDELTRTQLVNVSRLDFLKEQLLYFIGSLFVIIGGIYSLIFYRPFAKFRFIPIAIAITMSLFLMLRAKGYYAMGIYPILLAFGAVWIEVKFSSKNMWIKTAVCAIPIIIFIPFLTIAMPVESAEHIASNNEKYRSFGLLRWEDGREHSLPQDYADMIGWRELAAIADSAMVGLDGHVLVLCDNYGQAGAINHYSKNKNINAVSLNADYINWFPLDKPIDHIILVQDANDDDPERTDERDLFQTIYKAGSVSNKLARESGTSVYVLKDSKTDINAIIEKDISNFKSAMD